MAPNPGNQSVERYDEAPDKRVQRRALIEQAEDLVQKKTATSDAGEIQAIDTQLQSLEDQYVDLMKEEYGKRRPKAYFRKQFKNRINRQARRGLANEVDVNHDGEIDLNVNVVGAPEAPSRRPESAPSSVEREIQIEEIQSTTSSRLEDLGTAIDVYIGSKNKLILIAQKFREAEPPLVASSLLSGPDVEYAITVALYDYPVLARDYIRDLKAGGPKAAEARTVLTKLSNNLAPHISTLIQKEELQAETLKDDVTKHAASGLKKVTQEFQRHPMAALVGAAALTGAIVLLWKTGGDTAKKWLRTGAIAGGLIGGGGILANMLYRSQTDDGSDLFDLLGLRTQDMTAEGAPIDRIAAMYPGLNIENDQAARDLERMLNSDCDDIYTVFSQAFKENSGVIDTRALARMSAGPDDLKLSEAQSMNGKASYKALEDVMVMLARKNGKEGKTHRETVDNGMRIFYSKFVNNPGRPNLNSALLMTVDQRDVKSALSTTGVDLEGGGFGAGEVLDSEELARQKRIIDDFKKKGLDKWTDSDGDEHPTHIEVVPGRQDGLYFVRINDYPFEYKYDAERELHTFKDPFGGKEYNVGKTVADKLGEIAEKRVQQAVNNAYPGSSLASRTAGEIRLEYDEQEKEWVGDELFVVPAIPAMGLQARKRNVAVVFEPGTEKVNLRVQESDEVEGVGSLAALEKEMQDSRVEEIVDKDLLYIVGTLPVHVTGHGQPVGGPPDEYAVDIEWGAGRNKGQVVYKNKEVTRVVLSTSADVPKELQDEWENMAAREAEDIVRNNKNVERVFTNLAAAFAAKQDYPSFPTTLTGLKDIWTYLSNIDLPDEDKKWLEAVNFEQNILYAETKRSIMTQYSESFAADGSTRLTNDTLRRKQVEANVINTIINPRLGRLEQLNDEITGSTNMPGQLENIQEAKIRELRESHITVDGYREWFKEIEELLKPNAKGWNPDTVGMEGLEKSRLVHDAILLTIFEYTYPLSVDQTKFDTDPNSQIMLGLIQRKLPTIISTAIQNQEGNWWIDERYNTASFKAALDDAGIKPLTEMDFTGIIGNPYTIKPPVYEVEYDEVEGPKKIDGVPKPREDEEPIDYSRRTSEYIRKSALTLYGDIDDIEKSFTDDEFDNFVNWRVKRYVDEYNEYFRAQVYPYIGVGASPYPNPKPTYNAQLELYAKSLIDEMKMETQDLSGYQVYLENPEGLFNIINVPGREADPDDWRQAETTMLRGMIRRNSPDRKAYQDASEEMLDWMNATYQNENLLGLKVNWVRQDIAEIWMDKIDFGGMNVMAPGDVEEYRKFFTSVAQSQLSELSYSADDWKGMFKRNSASEWKVARGRLKAIPNFEEWTALKNTLMAGAEWKREEVASLDWASHEKLREYKEMRTIANAFMDEFDNDINVAEWTRLDGRWPELFHEHAKSRLELEIIPRCKNKEELKAALIPFRRALHVEAAFYNRLIESKLEATDGTEFKSIAAPAGIVVGALGGSVTGMIVGAPAGVPGALGGAALGAGGGAVAGGLLGEAVEHMAIPQPGFDYGELLFTVVREDIDEAFKDEFLSLAVPAIGSRPVVGGTGLPSNESFDSVKYGETLNDKLEDRIRDAIAKDASEFDLGPITLAVPGSAIDGVQVSP